MMTSEQVSPESDDVAPSTTGRRAKPTMAVKVFAPFQVYYEGDAYSVSATNEVGPFDILPRHRNFICRLLPGTLAIQTPDGPKLVTLSRALMHVKADRVVVFVDV